MKRGRPTTALLSREGIVAAALQLASEHKAPTMGAVSRALGVHVTSLYNHVADRADLIDAVREAIAAEAKDEPLPAAWPQRLHALGHNMHGMFRDYPGLVVPFATTPVGAPAVSALYDSLIASIVAEGVPVTIAIQGVRAMNALVLGIALDELDPDTEPEAAAQALQLGLAGVVEQLRAAASHPAER